MADLLRRRLRLVLAVAVGAAVLVGGWMLVRDSPLVAVNDVEVAGVQGRQADEIRSALARAARRMTTLHVDERELLASVEAYPVVRSLRTERRLLHGLRIVVNAYDPVVALESGGRRTAVAADGTLLPGASTEGLPRLKFRGLDGGDRVSDEKTLRVVQLLAAAPPALRSRVQRVFRGRRGLSTTLREGPKLYFGGSDRFAAKWAAAAQVLADGGAQGAAFIDVRLPGRPSAGGLPPLPPEPQPEGAPVAPSGPAAPAVPPDTGQAAPTAPAPAG